MSLGAVFATLFIIHLSLVNGTCAFWFNSSQNVDISVDTKTIFQEVNERAFNPLDFPLQGAFLRLIFSFRFIFFLKGLKS